MVKGLLKGCDAETSFEIIVNSLPILYPPSPLELCDVNNPGNEQEEFDLTDATLEINGGDTSIDIKYYQTQLDADNDTNALTSPYENTSNNQTIYIRAEDSDTGCFVSTGYTLTLTVNPLPSPEIPVDPIEVCDVDNDGIAEFDLGGLTTDIIGGEPNIADSISVRSNRALPLSLSSHSDKPSRLMAATGSGLSKTSRSTSTVL